jgi:hypothetical protein
VAARTFETDHRRTLSGGACERRSTDSVNGSDNEEESEHAISDSHDSCSVSLSRPRQLSLGGASNLYSGGYGLEGAGLTRLLGVHAGPRANSARSGVLAVPCAIIPGLPHGARLLTRDAFALCLAAISGTWQVPRRTLNSRHRPRRQNTFTAKRGGCRAGTSGRNGPVSSR